MSNKKQQLPAELARDLVFNLEVMRAAMANLHRLATEATKYDKEQYQQIATWSNTGRCFYTDQIAIIQNSTNPTQNEQQKR